MPLDAYIILYINDLEYELVLYIPQTYINIL